MENNASLYGGLREAYKLAEDALHALGIETDKIATASVNELRYAGFHALAAITAKTPDEEKEQVQRSLRHCERALYEAYDSAIYYQITRFQQFKDDYATMVVTDIVNDYVEIVRKMREAKKFLKKARSDSSDRAEYYRQAETIYSGLSESAETLDSSRDELNKLQTQQLKAKFRQWSHIVTAVLTGVVSACIITFGKYLW